MSNNENMKGLYIVVGENCQLRCPFCFNRFDENFNNKVLELQDIPKLIDMIYEFGPSSVTLIGGEPLLPRYIDKVTTLVQEYYYDKRYKPISWCISSNLYYKKLSPEQIYLLYLLQALSTDSIAIGSSYSVDRFSNNNKDYFNIWKNNMWRLDSLGIRVGVTLTLTTEQIKYSPTNTFNILKSVKAKSINVERELFPKDTDEKKLIQHYKLSDLYMKQLFEIIPQNMNKQWDRFADAIKFKIPVFNNHCSQYISTIYPEEDGYKMRKGCVINQVGVDPQLWVEKVFKYKCIECKYYQYCKGDCECNRFACAFPKQTIDYMKKVLS